jgi:hypothetical protein
VDRKLGGVKLYESRSPEAYEELRKLSPVPFAIGEEFASKWQFRPGGPGRHCHFD